MEITLNPQERLFVLKTGNSVSCLGFQVVFEQGCEMVRRLAKKMPGLAPMVKSEIGTQAQYRQYNSLLAHYFNLRDKETWFDASTPVEVQRVLESARREERMLRLFTGDSDTGRDWLSEYETMGRVGRSMGPMRSPLLMEEGDNAYGGAILSHCLVRIMDVKSGRELYRHKLYHLPEIRHGEAPIYDQKEGYSHVVKVRGLEDDWDVHARFRSEAKLAHWLAYMTGESFDLRR